jgi:hypothetical protein
MEVVGRYSEVLNALGEPVEPDRYLLVARRAVEEAASVKVDDLPLETFDARTRFALSWVRLYARAVAPKSEARWQALASDLPMASLQGILTNVAKGVRFSFASEHSGEIDPSTAVIDVALAMAAAWPDGLDAVSEVLAASQRNTDDSHLWATMSFLSTKLPEADPDAIAWTALVRNRRGIKSVARGVASARRRAEAHDAARPRQASLFAMIEEGER